MTGPRKISNSRADKAGKALREWYMNPNSPRLSNLPVDHPVVEAAALMIFQFRPTFQAPLNKVAQGVRQFARSETGDRRSETGDRHTRVGQRLKREIMMIDKLARQGSLRLSEMQDVGGCRAILADKEQIDGVVKRVRRNWDVRGFKDYVVEPTGQGYRAVHVVVMRDHHLVEIQLRTPSQHQWALFVERLSHRHRVDLKSGLGPPGLLRYLERLAELRALTEIGEDADEGLVTELRNLRARVGSYIDRRP